MASPDFPSSSGSAVILNSGTVSVPRSHPPNLNSPKNALRFRIKISSHVSVAADSSVVRRMDGSESSLNPTPVIEPSNQHAIKMSDDPSVVYKNKASKGKLSPVLKGEPSTVIDTQPAVTNANHVPKVTKNNNQKKRGFSVTLPREEIEADIAAIEALSGGKRLRRPKKRDQPRSSADQRRLDRLFPGLEYLGFH